MSAENCPLKLIRETHNFEREKYHYLELDMPLDPNNPNGLKVSNKYKKLIHTDAESVLEFIVEYDGIVEAKVHLVIDRTERLTWIPVAPLSSNPRTIFLEEANST